VPVPFPWSRGPARLVSSDEGLSESDSMPTPRPNPSRSRRARLALAALAALTACGCQSGTGPLMRWKLAGDDVIAPPPTAQEVGDTRRPLARLFTPEKAPKSVDEALRRAGAEAPPAPKADPETDAELSSAMALYKKGQLAEAERIFARLDRVKNKGAAPPFLGNVGRKNVDASQGWTRDLARSLGAPWARGQSPVGETVLFYLAESQYHQGKLVAANDSYAKLATTYAGSPYLEKVAAREYAIATLWLEAIDPKAPPEKRERPGDRFNGYLPAIDVGGPLADDAVMKIADFYFEKGNYEEASLYYDQLIEDEHLARSPLQLTAHLRSIDAKLKAYIGPEYDAAGLDDAARLIRKTMTTFPDRDEKADQFLMHGLALVNDQKAEITFRRGEFYRKTGYPGAAELCYGEVRARWPKSDWAARSKAQLELIAKAPRKEVLPSKIMTTPGAPDPAAAANGMGSAGGGMGGMGGMGGGMGGMGGGPY
jgi:tetratricopeptide (TPR) repeat protein